MKPLHKITFRTSLCGVCEKHYEGMIQTCPHCGASYNKQWQKRFKFKTEIIHNNTKYVVSTVNLIFHHFNGFYETMIFEVNGNFYDFQERYYKKEDAVKRHYEIANCIKKVGLKRWMILEDL